MIKFSIFEGGKFEKRGPISSVTIKGRTYHFIMDQSTNKISSPLGIIMLDQPLSYENEFVDAEILQEIFEVILYLN